MVALLLPGLLLLGKGTKTRRRRAGKVVLGMLLLAALLYCFSGCGSSGGGSGGGGGTPAGTYTVTVAGSSSGVTYTTSIKLTIQ
jgi:hypothetical protein